MSNPEEMMMYYVTHDGTDVISVYDSLRAVIGGYFGEIVANNLEGKWISFQVPRKCSEDCVVKLIKYKFCIVEDVGENNG